MSIPTITASVYAPAKSAEDGFLPEGPRYFEWRGKHYVGWVNIQKSPNATTGSLWIKEWPVGELRQIDLPGRPGFFVPLNGSDDVILGLSKAICRLNLATGEIDRLAEIEDQNPRTIINDAEATPDGKYIVFGTKDTLFQNAIANLYLFDVSSQKITHLADRQTCSNGKILHADDSGYTLWDIDTPTQCVRRYHLCVKPVSLTLEKVELDLKSAIGFPDGMVDYGEGKVLIAFYNPDPAPVGLGVVYDLGTGDMVKKFELPGSPRVTCPLILSDETGRKVLFTTATEGMPKHLEAECPSAGALFMADDQ